MNFKTKTITGRATKYNKRGNVNCKNIKLIKLLKILQRTKIDDERVITYKTCILSRLNFNFGFD